MKNTDNTTTGVKVEHTRKAPPKVTVEFQGAAAVEAAHTVTAIIGLAEVTGWGERELLREVLTHIENLITTELYKE